MRTIQKRTLYLVLGLVCLSGLGVGWRLYRSNQRKQEHKAVTSTKFRELMAGQMQMVAYSPTPDASALEIQAALTVLRQKFDSLSLYGCTTQTQLIVEAARRLRYRAVLLTVWDPKAEAELAIASSLTNQYSDDMTFAVSIGSEGLMQKRYELSDLEAARAELLERGATAQSVEMTTTEPWWLYLRPEEKALRNFGEFSAVNVHVVWDTDIAAPATAAAWTADRMVEVRRTVARPVLLREAGYPGGGHTPRDGGSMTFTRAMQKEFWEAWLQLAQRPPAVVFEAVDNEDKHWRGFESDWGLLDEGLHPWPAWDVFPVQP